MAITNITISQDNKKNSVNLLAVHSPLIFLIDVAYTGDVPDLIYCDVKSEANEVLDTFRCIPYSDVVEGTRTFMFVADSILRGFMGGFEDFAQSANNLSYVPDMTMVFNLKFYYGEITATTQITAVQSAKQFGDDPCLENINDDETVVAFEDKPAYAYVFNDNTSNTILAREEICREYPALDYDDSEFTDYNDSVFTINSME